MSITRRSLIGSAALSPFAGRLAHAAGEDATIAWPNDVPGWDPNQRFTPDAQSLYKAVFDQPIDQDPKLRLIPHLLTKWELSPDALTMPVELRDDVRFHDGQLMTTEDFRYTFFDRIHSTPGCKRSR